MLSYYLMPHPPIIIPDIGIGEEKKIESTEIAFLNLAEKIKNLNPDSIVLITPHGPLFNDAVALSFENKISGDLSQFKASRVKFEQYIDVTLTNEIHNLSKENNLSTVLLTKDILRKYGREFELDHGAMVPLYFINQFNKDYKLVHITYGMLSNIDLFHFGTMIKNAIEKLNRNAVIIASGDLSHRLTNDGPYPYSEKGKIFDDKILSLLQNGNVRDILCMDKKLIEEAGECGFRSILVLLGSINEEFKGDLLSYEGPFGVGYALMDLKITGNKIDFFDEFVKERKKELKQKQKNSDEYVKLARKSLESYLNDDKLVIIDQDIPKELLKEKAGVFVSLKIQGELRGCIGTFLPTTSSIAEEIIKNAVDAASCDPRFPSVSYKELDDIEISVDVLSKPVAATIDELNPKRYGVIVSKGIKRGLLLPDLDGVDSVEVQLRIACQKAGINPNTSYSIEKFSVIRHIEGEYSE